MLAATGWRLLRKGIGQGDEEPKAAGFWRWLSAIPPKESPTEDEPGLDGEQNQGRLLVERAG